MILVIDNYDSFTYNLVQYLGELGAQLAVSRNDKVSLEEIAEMKPAKIVISPGPCTPKEAGISVAVVKSFGEHIPILGVCLGHQSVGYAYGGDVVRADAVMHGKTSMIHHTGAGIFRDLKNPFEATRYHSLIVKRDTLPEVLDITAWTSDGTIMGIKHKSHPVWGVQFHPESILTGEGKKLLNNFLAL
jgi:anthranilate synthase/aminodeoxychorismate synthase-like glutamine amidotransferase